MPSPDFPTTPPSAIRTMPRGKRMLLWTRTLHIYLSTLALMLVLFFAATGFMMNHPDWFNVDGQTNITIDDKVPVEVLHPRPGGISADLAIVEYLRTKFGAKGEMDASGIHDDPIRIVFKGPHYSFDASIDASAGTIEIIKTKNSVGGFLAALHKGDETGPPWKRIIDATSILLMLISLTGLILWMTLAKRRRLGLISMGVCLLAVLAAFVFLVP